MLMARGLLAPRMRGLLLYFLKYSLGLELNPVLKGTRVNLPIQINTAYCNRVLISTLFWFEPGWFGAMKLIKPQGSNQGFTVYAIILDNGLPDTKWVQIYILQSCQPGQTYFRRNLRSCQECTCNIISWHLMPRIYRWNANNYKNINIFIILT